MIYFQCHPVAIYPMEPIGFSSCEIVPGVTFRKIPKDLHLAMTAMLDRIGTNATLHYVPPHGIFVHEKKYLDRLRARLADEGKELPRYPRNRDMPEFVDTQAIFKQVIVSMVMLAQIHFETGGSFQLKVTDRKGRKKYTTSGYSNTPAVGNYRTTRDLFQPKTESPLTGNHLKQFAMQLDRYYRTGNFWTDRLGMALGFLWSAMCTSSRDHTFVGLTMALEAVLSTDRNEITHQLAERVAILLGDTRKAKLDIYQEVKQLYGIRSKLVHGDAGPKKGAINMESLAVIARRIIVPQSKTNKLMNLTIQTLTKLSLDREYTAIIWAEKKEAKANDKIRELFVQRLFS